MFTRIFKYCHNVLYMYNASATASNAIWPYGIVVSGYSPNVNCHLLIGLQLKQLAPLKPAATGYK